MKVTPLIAVTLALLCRSAGAEDLVLAAGGFETLALTADGRVLGWGEFGGMTPYEVSGLPKITAVSAGHRHVLALGQDGTVWAWGDNGEGQLGDGTGIRRDRPVRVMDLSGVIAITAGSFQSFALKNDGTVWGWGDNRNGQLGDGTRVSRRSPVVVEGLVNVRAIAAGTSHLVALRRDGNVMTQGLSTRVDPGLDTASIKLAPTAAPEVSDAVSIAAGGNAAYAIRRDGTLVAWGLVPCAGMAQPSGGMRLMDRTKRVAAGTYHVIALRDDGTVWSCGAGDLGQLGYGGKDAQGSMIQVGGGLFNIETIAAGFRHSAARDQSGSVWAWGDNSAGQLGTGDREPRTTPSPVWDGTGQLRQ